MSGSRSQKNPTHLFRRAGTHSPADYVLDRRVRSLRVAGLGLCSLVVLACSAAGSATGRDAGSSGQRDGSIADASGGMDAIADGAASDAAADTTTPDAPGYDAGKPDSGSDAGDAATVAPPKGWPQSRAWKWMRTHPMFVAALTVRMGAPPAAAVNRYFGAFGAEGIELWSMGLPDALNGWLAQRPGAPWVSWVQSDGTSAANGSVLGGLQAATPGRIGYQIGDEPGTTADMTAILGGLTAVKAADPGGLRIVNFSYDAAVSGGLVDQYCASGLGDIVSYDLYSRANQSYEKLAYFRDKGLSCGMPYWRYIKAYIGSGGDPVQTESDLRWAAFIGLTYGYTGHSWFLYLVKGGAAEGIPTTFFTNTEDWASPTTQRFGWAAAINREMRVYGRALTHLLSRNVGWATTTALPGVWPPKGTTPFNTSMDPYLTSIDPGGGGNALLGFFVDRWGDRYVIVQNPNHTNGSFPTQGDGALQATLHFSFPAGSGVDTTHLLVLDGTTGAVKTQPLTGGALKIQLPAGDLLFFKYDTGHPFAGY